MADDKEVAVKISADVKSLLQGMKDAQEHTEKAVAGMKGDLNSMIESFEHFGVASLAIGAAGLAFEGLKESLDFVKEASDQTNELARTFKDLSFQLGINFDELNKLSVAQQLTGGTVQELEGWMKGATRAMRQNADMLVENGIAANKAELMSMPFVDVLKRVMEAAESIQEPQKRAIFLQEALGRAGLQSAPQIREMLEQLENAPAVLGRYGRAIGVDNLEQMERFERATGKVNVATQGLKQTLTETFGDNLITAKERWAEFTAALGQKGLMLFGPSDSAVARKQIEELKAAIAQGQKDIRALGGTPAELPGGEHGKKDEKHIKTKEELDEEKKLAEERRAIRKSVDDDIIRSAAFVVGEQKKEDLELVAAGKMAYADLVADMRQAYKVQLDTSMKALEDEKKLAARKPLELQAILNKQKELNQKYYADINELDRQAAEHARKEAEKTAAEVEKARKEKLELAKLAAQDELNLQKAILDEKERALDQDLVFGKLNEAQWVAMKKAGITQELRAQLDALDMEQKAAENDLVHWQKIQNQKDALNRKAYAELGKLDAEVVAKSKSRWENFFGSMTGGFDSAIKGLIHGTMTWGDAFKTVMSSALDGVISFFVRWAEEEAIKWATGLALGATSRVAEAEGAAAVYAVNAMGSVAAIPVVGWEMAPEVGAAAYAEGLGFAGLASAEKGWDRVPADQIAQLHKNEMVLPAPLAEGVRNMTEGGGGGETHVHLHGTLIDAAFWRQNQGHIVRTIGDAVKNRRMR